MSNILRLIGIGFFVAGIFLLGLSGLEQVLIYATLGDRVGDIDYLREITPKYIWNITKITFSFGVILTVCGLLFLINYKNLKKYITEINQKNNEYKKQIEESTK